MNPMAAKRAYLDHNATTPLRPAARDAIVRALHEADGNPSSVHFEGRAARKAVEIARKQVAAALGGDAKDVIFTSGATEGLNLLLRPSPAVACRSGALQTTRLLVLATEHSAALSGGGFAAEQIEYIPVNGDGLADLDWLEARLGALSEVHGFAPVTVALQLANSETGVIQPIAEASHLTGRFGSLLVVDAVAACGKIPLELKALRADALVVAAHKFGGPKGAGAVIINGANLQLDIPLFKGGGQEMRRRSGTENVPAIAGMGAALVEATAALDEDAPRITALRAELEAQLLAIRPDAIVAGAGAPRLPNTVCLVVPGLKAETALIAFDLAGVAVSSGSACSSGKVKTSHVLEAMGFSPAGSASALRFSLGWNSTSDDIEQAVAAFAIVAGAGIQRDAA